MYRANTGKHRDCLVAVFVYFEPRSTEWKSSTKFPFEFLLEKGKFIKIIIKLMNEQLVKEGLTGTALLHVCIITYIVNAVYERIVTTVTHS